MFVTFDVCFSLELQRQRNFDMFGGPFSSTETFIVNSLEKVLRKKRGSLPICLMTLIAFVGSDKHFYQREYALEVCRFLQSKVFQLQDSSLKERRKMLGDAMHAKWPGSREWRDRVSSGRV